VSFLACHKSYCRLGQSDVAHIRAHNAAQNEDSDE
jgi:hypothetical protein